MNVLTNGKINQLIIPMPEREIMNSELATFARAIEAAVIKHLAAGVRVEPYATLHHDDGYFTTKQREHDLRYSGPMRTEVVTLDQLNTALAAARVQENERCAQFCHPSGLAYGIRALLVKEDQS